MMTRCDEFLVANTLFAETFDQSHLPMPPARKVAIVACMDARLHPEKVLGLAIGDAHVIRNAGGRAQDALRSLVISERLLGTTEIVVLHHTDCGMLTFTNEQLAAKDSVSCVVTSAPTAPQTRIQATGDRGAATARPARAQMGTHPETMP